MPDNLQQNLVKLGAIRPELRGYIRPLLKALYNKVAYRKVAYSWWVRRARSTMTPQTAYNLLELPQGSSLDAVKGSFKRLIHVHHPDKGGDRYKAGEIIEAYQYLKEQFESGYSPRPSSAPWTPPRPTPQPAPRPTPTPQPQQTRPQSGAMTWREAERLTGGSSRPDSKDVMRMNDIIRKANGSIAKMLSLATVQANAIKEVGKALRRGRAAEETGDTAMIQVAQIFYKRALALAGV